MLEIPHIKIIVVMSRCYRS